MWFPGPNDWPVQGEGTFEFREDGLETVATGPVGGQPYCYAARYHDIVPSQRIIFSFEMSHAGRRISV